MEPAEQRLYPIESHFGLHWGAVKKVYEKRARDYRASGGLFDRFRASSLEDSIKKIDQTIICNGVLCAISPQDIVKFKDGISESKIWKLSVKQLRAVKLSPESDKQKLCLELIEGKIPATIDKLVTAARLDPSFIGEFTRSQSPVDDAIILTVLKETYLLLADDYPKVIQALRDGSSLEHSFTLAGGKAYSVSHIEPRLREAVETQNKRLWEDTEFRMTYYLIFEYRRFEPFFQLCCKFTLPSFKAVVDRIWSKEFKRVPHIEKWRTTQGLKTIGLPKTARVLEKFYVDSLGRIPGELVCFLNDVDGVEYYCSDRQNLPLFDWAIQKYPQFLPKMWESGKGRELLLEFASRNRKMVLNVWKVLPEELMIHLCK